MDKNEQEGGNHQMLEVRADPSARPPEVVRIGSPSPRNDFLDRCERIEPVPDATGHP